MYNVITLIVKGMGYGDIVPHNGYFVECIKSVLPTEKRFFLTPAAWNLVSKYSKTCMSKTLTALENDSGPVSTVKTNVNVPIMSKLLNARNQKQSRGSVVGTATGYGLDD
jgi:hypothetical protein